MIIPDIVRFINGYLTLRVRGLNIEKFFNMAVINGVKFWNIERIGLTEAEFNVSIRGYFLLKKVLKKTGCQVSIMDKYGLPFLILKLKRRSTFAIGFLIFILILVGMSSFIWSIKVIGANSVSTEEIEKKLAELGVKPGALKINIAVSDVENNMLIKMSSLSWIKVKLVGTRAEVEVKERVVPFRTVPDEKPCNIVAKRDGIIIKIVSAKGDVLVSEGEPVKKGQVLVTGVIQRPNIETRYVHASAQATARTWYEGSSAVPFEQLEKIRTGNKQSKIYLYIGSKKFQIKNTNINYKSYDKIEKSTKFIDTDSFELPAGIIIEEYWETALRTRSISVEQAKAEAADKVEKSILESLPPDAKIINKKINISVKDNIAYVNELIETIEDIGMKEEIKINGEA